MEIIATQKYLLMSPKKIRPVADLAKKMKPREAIEKLPFVGKKAAIFVVKVIKTALANAKNKGLSEDKLYFKEIQITEGPRLKRGRPVSKGRWHPIIKRMSHIRIVLGTEENSEKEVKKEEKQKKEVGNKKTGKTVKVKKKGKK